MDIHEIEGQKFKIIRDINGSILRLAPINPGTLATRWVSDEEDDSSDSADVVETTPEPNDVYQVENQTEFDQPSEVEEHIIQMKPRQMLARSTEEIDEPVYVTDSEKAESISSEGSDSIVDVSEREYPSLPQSELKEKSCDFISIPVVDVCYKPTFRTLKKLQMRDGPGAHFEPIAIIPADTQVYVLAEGLAECTPEMFQIWWSLHVTHNNQALRVPKVKDIMNRRGKWETWASFLGFSGEQVASIMKHMHAANRKVKVAVKIDGEQKFGWISKRKNSGPMIKRVFGAGLPVVQVDNLGSAGSYAFVFRKEMQKYREEHHDRMPRRNFYSKLLKKATGCDKVEWEARWISDRQNGSEIKTLPDGRVRTGYYKPESTAFLVYSSLHKAKDFINNAQEKLGQNVKADLEAEFANLGPVLADECSVEWYLFEQELKLIQSEGHTKEDIIIQENKAKECVGIYAISTL